MPVTYTMEVTPNPASVPQGQSQQFTATKVGSDGSRSNPPVIWSTNAGTITSDGLFTPSNENFGSGYPAISDGALVTIPWTVTATENDAGTTGGG